MFLRTITTISMFAGCSAAFAAAEFPGGVIPTDIAEAFTFGQLYSGLPDNFPTPVLPPNTPIDVRASSDNGTSQRVLLGTTLPIAELREVLVTGYAANGWVELVRNPAQVELCHDTLGSLFFQMVESSPDEARVLAIRAGRVPMSPDSLTCAEQRQFIETGTPTTPALVFSQAVPNLDMPPEAGITSPSFPIRGSSSGNGPNGYYQETDLDFALVIPNYSLGRLLEFFAPQMEQLGWVLDGDFTAVQSASAIWFKTAQVPARGSIPASSMKLTADMTLLKSGADAYRVKMTISTGDPASGLIGIRGL